MRRIIFYFVLSAGLFSFVSCAKRISADSVANGRPCSNCSARYSPTETSLAVKRETKKMLQSRIDKMAGAETNDFTYYFVINENKTFSVIVNIHGTRKYDFRAGTFQSNGDTLNLNYYKNLKSDYLTDKAIVNNINKEVYFLNTDLAKTTRLKILNEL